MNLIGLLLAGGLFAAGTRWAVVDKWYFGSSISWYDPDGYTWDDATANTTKHPFDGLLDSSCYGKGYVGYTFTNNWRLTVSAGKWSSTGSRSLAADANISNSFDYMVQDSSGNGQPYDGIDPDSAHIDASVKPIELDISYVFPFRYRKFKPFAGIGYGRYRTESNFSWRDSSALPLLSLRCIDSVSCLSFHGGVEYFVNRDFSVRLEGKYVLNDNDLSIQPEDISYNVNAVGTELSTLDLGNIVSRYNTVSDKVEIDGFQFGTGFSFYFR